MFSSIRFKVVAAIVTSLVLGGAVIIWFIAAAHDETLQASAAGATRTSIAAFERLKQDEIRAIKGVMELIATSPEYRRHFAARDREKLLEWARPIYARYKQAYGFTNWNNIDLDHKQFLRLTKPEDFGDAITRFNVSETHRTRDVVAGLEQGGQGFALRVSMPVFDQATLGDLKAGTLVGIFEIGTNVTRFLEMMKEQTGDDYGMVLRKDAIDPKKWASTRDYDKLRNNWDDQKDIVVAHATTADEHLFAYAGDTRRIPAPGAVLELLERGGRHFVRSAFSIPDPSGQKQAAVVFVLHDVTEPVVLATAVRNRVVGAVVVLLVLVLIVVIGVFNRLVVRRLNAMVETATLVVGGDYQRHIVPSANDEIGQFERLFDQFREIFVGLAESASDGERARKTP